MRFLKITWLSILTVTLFVISSCQRDLDLFVPDNNNIGQILNPSPVQASLKGKVIDENDNAVAGAIVRAGNSTTTTDSRGLFSFYNIQLDKYASVVTVENNGYFKGIRTFSAATGSSNFVKLKLIPKTLAGSIDATGGGTVTLANSSSIIFPANGFIVKSTGQPYSGSVNVFAATIDPTSADIPEIVPGSFQATTVNNFRVTLKSFGMAAVLLEGQSGESLQIATGKTAKLRLTIPASLTASAPATMDMWFLNETDGLWKQEGIGTKNGNYYEGDVSHFTFWNYDIGNNSIFLELTVHSPDGPLPNTIVKISSLNYGSSFGYTDSLGHVGGLVFANEPLVLEILNSCYQPVYSQNIGPFSQNTDLGVITVTIPAQTSLTISGNAIDCSSLPVSNGNAFIYFEGQLYTTLVSAGNFSLTITRCTSTAAAVEIVVMDNASQQQSATWTGNASTGSINTGTINACVNSTQQFINYSINGVDYSFTSPSDSLGHYSTQGTTFNSLVTGSDLTNFVNIGFVNTGIGPGSSQELLYFTGSVLDSSTTIPTPIFVDITEYGSIGQFVSGNFSGTLMGGPPTNTPYSITCSFRVRRTF